LGNDNQGPSWQNEHDVFQAFVHSLAATAKKAGQFLFEEAAGVWSLCHRSTRTSHRALMLSLAHEGMPAVSGAISTVHAPIRIESSSTGSNQPTPLTIGGCLADEASTETASSAIWCFASDELFSKRIPILVSRDPC